MKSSDRYPTTGACLVAAALFLSGCVGYSPGSLQPGTVSSELIARMGPPTAEYRLPGQPRRLEFARGPAGKHTYMVDVDDQGRVLRWNQVLTEANFNSFQAGLSRDELLYRLGRPAERMRLPRQKEDVWSYRYETLFSLCQWFQVSINEQQRVASTSYGIDPACDVASDRRADR